MALQLDCDWTCKVASPYFNHAELPSLYQWLLCLLLQEQYALPLKIVSYKDLYNWSMDDIVRQIGLKNNCTFCGVFRRQALDRGAAVIKADKITTGKFFLHFVGFS